MSIEITATPPVSGGAPPGTAAAAAAAAQPSVEITVYPHSLGVTAAGGAKSYMIPFRTIELMSLERRGDATMPVWVLSIQTTRQTLNMTSGRSIENEFRAASIAYNMG